MGYVVEGVGISRVLSAAEDAGPAFGEVDEGGEGCFSFAEALGVLLALEPAVDAGLGCAGLLHVGDDLGAGVGVAAVVDDFVEVFVEGSHWG